jgi:hypothetical protein
MKWHVVEANEELERRCAFCGKLVSSGDFYIARDFEGNEAEWIEHLWGAGAASEFGVCAYCLGDRPGISRWKSDPDKWKWSQYMASGIMRRLKLFEQVYTTLHEDGYEVEELEAGPSEMCRFRGHRHGDHIEVVITQEHERKDGRVEMKCKWGVEGDGDADEVLDLLEPVVTRWAAKEADALREMGIGVSDLIRCEEES